MMENDFLEKARVKHREVLNDLKVLVECESPSDDLVAIAKSAEALKRMITDRLNPSRVEILDVQGVKHVIAKWGEEQSRVLLLGHHDTVWPIGSLEKMPWSVSDRIIRGPGCFDMKLGLVQAIHALSILENLAEDLNEKLSGVCLLVTGDEETGSLTSRSLIEEEAKNCEAVYVMEAAADGGAIKIARKGVSKYSLTVKGRAAHAGLEPEKGINAVVEIAHQISAINALNNPDKGISVTPTVLSGGTTSNTVPDEAKLEVDVRAWDSEEQLEIDRQLRDLKPVNQEVTLKVAGGVNRLPFEKKHSKELYARAKAVAKKIGIDAPSFVAVGGASDGNFTAGLGVPTLDGLGAVGGGAHAATEHILEKFVDERVALLAALVQDSLSQTPHLKSPVVEVRSVATISELTEVVRIFEAVWQTKKGVELVNLALLRAMSIAGGYVSAAFKDGEMVGACFAFPDLPNKKSLHSHITGVLDSARGMGIGKSLKLHQKEWALERGLDSIKWTFDPLVAFNANFNFNTLGASFEDYLIDFYGPLDDQINTGEKTDRILINWKISKPSSSFKKRLKEGSISDVLTVKNGRPFVGEYVEGTEIIRIQIPNDINKIRKNNHELSNTWRFEFRRTLTSYLKAGWKITGFDEQQRYILEKNGNLN